MRALSIASIISTALVSAAIPASAQSTADDPPGADIGTFYADQQAPLAK
jgi:hypothetical protein